MNTFKDYVTNHLRSVLDRCNGSCNTFDDISGRIYDLNKIEDINLNLFNIIWFNMDQKDQ